MKKNTASVLRWIALGVGTALIFFLMAGIVQMLGRTMVNPVWIFLPAGLAAAISGTVFHRGWRKLTGTGNFAVNFLLNFVTVSTVLSAGVLLTNYLGADKDKMHPERYVIEGKLRKIRHKTRRVSRRVYVKGAPYHVHYLKVSVPDFKTMEIYVPQATYARTRTGDTVQMLRGRGALGLPVIDTQSLTLVHPRSLKRKGRCRFFGTSGRHSDEVRRELLRHRDRRE